MHTETGYGSMRDRMLHTEPGWLTQAGRGRFAWCAVRLTCTGAARSGHGSRWREPMGAHALLPVPNI
jgi:hypothetical protein